MPRFLQIMFAFIGAGVVFAGVSAVSLERAADDRGWQSAVVDSLNAHQKPVEKVLIEREIEIDPRGTLRLTLESTAADAKIVSTKKSDKLRVKIKGIAPKGTSPEVDIRTQGNDVHIQVKEKEDGIDNDGFYIRFENGDFNIGPSRDLDIAIEVPETMLTNLQSKSVSGDLKIKGLKVGEVSAETVSGDLKVEGASASNVQLRSTSGDLGLRDSNIAIAKVETTSGSVRLTLRDAQDIKARSVSGNVGVDLDEYADGLILDIGSVSGDVKLKVDEDKGLGILMAASQSGDLSVKARLSALNNEDDDRVVHGNFGSAGSKFTLKSISGNVTVRTAKPSDERAAK